MKKSVLTLSLLALSAGALSSDDVSVKYARQMLWKPVVMTSSDGIRFNGYRTTRNTVRLYSSSFHTSVPYTLKISAGSKDAGDWISTCKTMAHREKFKDFGDVRLIIGSPFAAGKEYSLAGQRVTWKDIENAPSIKDVRLVFEGNRESVSSGFPVREGGYGSYVSEVSRQLNERLASQKEAFLQQGKTELELDTRELKDFACDLTLKLADVSLEMGLEAEPPKLMEKHWIKQEVFEDLYKDLQAEISKRGSVNVFQAGLAVGKALSRLDENIDPLANQRDGKLFRTLFKLRGGKSLLELADLSERQLEESFADLPELDPARSTGPKGRATFELTELNLEAGE